MDRDKQYSEHSSEANWTEEQEKAYWHEVNKDRDERIALIHLKGLNAKGFVDAIATSRGYDGSDIYNDLGKQALDVEGSISRFLNEVEDFNAPFLINETVAEDA